MKCTDMDAQLNRALDETIYGGLDTLIAAASNTIAASTGNDDELFLLKEIFSKDRRALETCYCHRHNDPISKLVCASDIKKSTLNIATCSMNEAEAYLESEQYDKALEITAKAIFALEAESPHDGGRILWDCIDMKKNVYALRGRANLRLGEFEEALHSLSVAIGGDPSLNKSPSYGSKSSKFRCDACLDGIYAIVALGDVETAKSWCSYLMGLKVEQSDGNFTAEYLSSAQAEAMALVSSTPKVPASNQATIIEGGPALENISCPAREVSWKSVGKVDKDGSINPNTFAVPRLGIALIWVRGQLLIWNYKDSKVIQWIDVDCDDHWEELIDTEAGSLFVLYFRSRGHCIILLDEAHRLKQGATCHPLDAFEATFNVQKHSTTYGNQTRETWEDNMYGLRHFGDVSMFTPAQNKVTKSWSLAIVKDSVTAEIGIYTGNDTIAPGCALGPFALLKDSASFVLGGGSDAHLDYIYKVLFVENDRADTLVSSSSDKSIKIWDLVSQSCQHTIRGGFSTLVRTLASSSAFLFGSEMKKYGGSSSNEDNSHSINVWCVRSGQRKAILRSESGGTVCSFITLPQRGILLSGHSTGEVHMWQYGAKFEHIHGIRVLSSSTALGISLHDLHEDYIAVMNMTQLVMLQGATETKRAEDGTVRLPLIGQSLNCGNCGVWNIKSSWCSRCCQVRFCNRACQKEAWPKHKKTCHKRK